MCALQITSPNFRGGIFTAFLTSSGSSRDRASMLSLSTAESATSSGGEPESTPLISHKAQAVSRLYSMVKPPRQYPTPLAASSPHIAPHSSGRHAVQRIECFQQLVLQSGTRPAGSQEPSTHVPSEPPSADMVRHANGYWDGQTASGNPLALLLAAFPSHAAPRPRAKCTQNCSLDVPHPTPLWDERIWDLWVTRLPKYRLGLGSAAFRVN